MTSNQKSIKRYKTPTVRGATVAKLVRAFAPQAEGWVLKTQPQQTQVVKTGSEKNSSGTN